MATISPCIFMFLTMSCFSSGDTPAQTMSASMPTSFATCRAVTIWSPVTCANITILAHEKIPLKPAHIDQKKKKKKTRNLP